MDNMAGTYTKAIIEKNYRHIANQYRGDGGLTEFVRQVDMEKRHYGMNPYNAVAQIASSGKFLTYTPDIVKYLATLGLTDQRRLEKYEWNGMYGPFALYVALMARDGAKLYELLKAGKNPLTKKKPKAKKNEAIIDGTIPDYHYGAKI